MIAQKFNSIQLPPPPPFCRVPGVIAFPAVNHHPSTLATSWMMKAGPTTTFYFEPFEAQPLMQNEGVYNG